MWTHHTSTALPIVLYGIFVCLCHSFKVVFYSFETKNSNFPRVYYLYTHFVEIRLRMFMRFDTFTLAYYHMHIYTRKRTHERTQAYTYALVPIDRKRQRVGGCKKCNETTLEMGHRRRTDPPLHRTSGTSAVVDLTLFLPPRSLACTYGLSYRAFHTRPQGSSVDKGQEWSTWSRRCEINRDAKPRKTHTVSPIRGPLFPRIKLYIDLDLLFTVLGSSQTSDDDSTVLQNALTNRPRVGPCPMRVLRNFVRHSHEERTRAQDYNARHGVRWVRRIY